MFRALLLAWLLVSAPSPANESTICLAFRKLVDTQPVAFNAWYPLAPEAGKRYSVQGKSLFAGDTAALAKLRAAENYLIEVTGFADHEISLKELRTGETFKAPENDWYATPMRPVPADFSKLGGRLIWFGGATGAGGDVREYPSASTGSLITVAGSVGIITKIVDHSKAVVEFSTLQPAREAVEVPLEDLHFFTGSPEESLQRMDDLTYSLSPNKELNPGDTIFLPTQFGATPITFIKGTSETLDGKPLALIRRGHGQSFKVPIGEILVAPSQGKFTGIFSYDKEGHPVDFSAEPNRKFIEAAAALVSHPDFRHASEETRLQYVARFVKSLMVFDMSASFEPLEALHEPKTPLTYNLSCAAGVCRHLAPLVAQVMSLAGFHPTLKVNQVHVWTTVKLQNGKSLIVDSSNLSDNLLVDEATTQDARYFAGTVVTPK